MRAKLAVSLVVTAVLSACDLPTASGGSCIAARKELDQAYARYEQYLDTSMALIEQGIYNPDDDAAIENYEKIIESKKKKVESACN